jgi:hypothetical protein
MSNISGNHIGLVVNTLDPELRSRVQIFIPHLSNTLYKNWNEQLKDISFKTFSDDIFHGELKERLLSTLPWAEPAVPIWGGATGAPVYADIGSAVPIPTDQKLNNGSTATTNKGEGGNTSADNRVVETNAGANNTQGKFDGQTSGIGSGTSGNLACGSGANKISLQEAHDINANAVANSGLVGFIPKDGANYGIIKGTQEEWTAHFDRQMQSESTVSRGGITVNESFTESDGTISAGLYSMTVGERGLTAESINDPCANANAAIGMSADLIKGDGVIAGRTSSGKWLGQARYFGPIRRGEVALNGANPDTYADATQSSQNVFRTTNMGANAVGSVNGSRPGAPMGIFSPPQVGAKVWVFFQGDNIQRPVYFANVYEYNNVAAAS